MARIAPWVPSLDTILQTHPRPHTFTFCTVSRGGLPRARTCVLRSWLFDDRTTSALVFTTDKRSEKLDDLEANGGRFEACFYFGGDWGMQFRINGFAQVLTKDVYPSLVPPQLPTPGLSSSSSSASLPRRIEGYTPPCPPSPASSLPDDVNDKSSDKDLQLPSTINSRLDALSVTPPASSDWSTSPNSVATTGKEAGAADAAAAASAAPTAQPYPIYSPMFKQAHDIFTTPFTPPPPTRQDWVTEYTRLWSQMRPSMKSTFRRPAPASPLTAANARAIDSIARGVDGAHDEAGADNFVVVVMFCETVDVVRDRVGRRSVHRRLGGDEWVEEEVCP